MPVSLPLAPTCVAEMPSPGGGGGGNNGTGIHEPDVNEWSGLLVNEQEVAVAIHPVQAVDFVHSAGPMASNSNSIELTPLWPKNSPNHHGNGSRGGWPADHKTSKTVREGQKGPPPPPPPTSCPPAVPQKSKNPPQPPPLPAQSSKDFLQRKLRGQPNSNYLNSDGTEVKGPAPQPPVGGQHHKHSGHNQQMSGGGHPVTSQPLRYNIKSFRLL